MPAPAAARERAGRSAELRGSRMDWDMTARLPWWRPARPTRTVALACSPASPSPLLPPLLPPGCPLLLVWASSASSLCSISKSRGSWLPGAGWPGGGGGATPPGTTAPPSPGGCEGARTCEGGETGERGVGCRGAALQAATPCNGGGKRARLEVSAAAPAHRGCQIELGIDGHLQRGKGWRRRGRLVCSL